MAVEDEAAGRIARPVVPVVTDESTLDEVVKAYLAMDEFVIDVETVGPARIDPRRNEVLWIGLAGKGRSDVIPMGHPNGELQEIKRGLLPSGVHRLAEGKPLRKGDVSKSASRVRKVFDEPPAQLYPNTVFEALRPLLFSERRKIGANIKFDLESIAKYYSGELAPPLYGDVIIADFLLDDTHTNQMSLAHITKRRLGYDMPKGVGKEVEAYSLQEVARYLHGDVKFTWLLWQEIMGEIAQEKLLPVFDLEMDLLEAIMHMEQAGVLIDTDAMRTFATTLEEDLNERIASAYRHAGRPFNINSPADKIQVLFSAEGRGLTPTAFTAKSGQPSTAAADLAPLSKDPLVLDLLTIADLRKLQSTYVIPYLGGEVTRTTGGKTRTESRDSLLVRGRVHTNFKQHGARTGRMSSNSPNLQNIPSRGDHGKLIRSMFVADPGHKLIRADYKQIEPRVMASFSGDKAMIEAFLTGVDIYQLIADQLNVSRDVGKMLILAMAYGLGASSMGEKLQISDRKAHKLLDDFSAEFPQLAKYKNYVIRKAERRRPMPYVNTVLGRKRKLPLLRSHSEEQRAQGRRQAFNTLIQGSSADVLKVALVRAHRAMPEGTRLVLTVHDEIVALSPDDTVDESVEALRWAMEEVGMPQIKVPLLADIGVGNNWLEAK